MKPALALIALSAFAADVFTTSDLWSLRTVSNPLITPDGKRVIYTLTWADPMTDSFYTNLWIVGADGKDARPLTSGKFKDTAPKLSPDGTRIAFVSNRSGKSQIHLLWLDTLQQAPITNLEQSPSGLAWSPDSSAIAYTARVPAKPPWSVKMPEKPPGAQWSDPPIVVTRLRWRADAAGITPPGHRHIFVVPASGGAPRQVTSGDFDHSSPEWMPDGKSILFEAARIDDADYNLEGGEIYRVSLAAGAIAPLTARKGPDSDPTPSPDGKRIAFRGSDYKFQSYTVGSLSVMDADGKNVRQITGKLDRDVRSIAWSPDGKKLYFLADNRGGSQLYSATLDGNVEALTSPQLRLGSHSRYRPTGRSR